MGQEIVYCSKCQTQLRSANFEKGTAFHIEGQAYCKPCARDVVKSFPPEKLDPLLKRVEALKQAEKPPTSGTPLGTQTDRIMRVAAGPPPTRRLIRERSGPGTAVAALTGVGVLVVGAIMVMTGGGRAPAQLPTKGTPSSQEVRSDVPAPPGDPVKPSMDPPRDPAVPSLSPEKREQVAKETLHKAREFASANPGDFTGQHLRFEQAAWDSRDTSLQETARAELRAVEKRQRETLSVEFSGLDEKTRPALASENFSMAINLLEEARKLHSGAEWTGAINQKIAQVNDAVAKLYAPLKDKALEARKRGGDAEQEAVCERVRKWGLAAWTADLEKALAEAALSPTSPLILPGVKPPLVEPVPSPSVAILINSGGGAVGTFVADTQFAGGNTYSTTAAIDTSEVTNPAPMSVYQTERIGNFAYTVGGLIPGGSYTVRLHFAEFVFTVPGKRIFNVSINGNPVLSKFDIVADIGAPNKADIREFPATGDGTGQITITYYSVVNNAKSSGIEIVSGSSMKPSPAPRKPARPAVPDAVKQRDVEAAVRKTFNLDQAKTAKDKADLARTLVETAANSGAKDAELFVLLRLARDLAAQGMDVKTALEAINARAAAFEVDAMGEKVDLFARTTAKGQDAAAWAGAALDVAQKASEADDYETAVKLVARAEALARASNDKGLQETARERSKEISDLKRATDGLKGHFKTLETKPDDPAANAAVGKFVCLVKRDWKRGIPMLEKGSEPALKALAQQELGNPADAADQQAIGEAWAAVAEKEPPPYKARARDRAAEWLGRAIPGLTGVAKVTAERKLASLGPSGGPKSRQILDLGAGVRMELVTIKPGTFTMGSTEAPKESWQLDERPEHKVTITKGYSLGKYDVTRGQFSAFVNATGYKTDAEKEGKSWGRRDGNWGEIAGANWKDPVLFKQTDEHPATCISWNDAKAFCDWATKKTGREVRLPTEAEWEYACRAGTKTKWSFGDNEAALVEYGWTNMNSGLQTLPVGQRQPNPWGLYDMNGNVCEWCQDWAGPYAGDAVDPTGPASGDRRCLRGGSWNNNAIECRSAFRFNDTPSNPVTINGFRVAVP